MDSLQFDAYTPSSYSGSSAPRTPSPHTSDDMQPYTHSPANFKQPLDIDAAHNIFADYQADESVVPETHSIEPAPFWSGVHTSPAAQYANRGSLLQELYEHDIPHDQPSAHEMYLDQHAAERPSSGHSDWSQMSHEQNLHMQAHQQQQHHSQVQMQRRNTFPIVRHDRDNAHGNHQFFNPSLLGGDHGSVGPFSRPDNIYGQPMPLSAEPSILQGNEPFLHSMSSSPRGSYREFEHLDEGVKLEDAPPVIVPSQTAFYRPPSGGAMHPMSMSYLSPHTGLPVQHTDDAASKETQYLRRRCFNCHTTEPPSWRRSTLNPGKIVCNKCGLYERTHLRPRPLRFDELRAGNKARKQSKSVVGSQSPKQKLGGLVKKEPREFVGLARRSSVSSTSSSVHSGTGATSDWDDNVSVYSSGSGPSSTYNSPSISTFPIPRDPNSQSPPLPSGGIRLPNNPLTDIASLQPHSPPSAGLPTPRKAATAPGPYYNNAYPTPPGTSNGPASHHMFELRRGSLPVDFMGAQRRVDMPESTGWQNVQMADMSPAVSEIGRQTAVAT